MNKAHQLGKRAEAYAAQFLLAQGYQIVAENFTVPKLGEIDIIAKKTKPNRQGQPIEVLVCVEVRARSKGAFGLAADTISASKQKKLIKTLLYFVDCHPEYQGADLRFDVIAVDVDETSEFRIDDSDWICGAFLADDCFI